MQNKTTIQINGRVYDAKTGTLLQGEVAHQVRQATATIQKNPKKQFVDGFVRHGQLPVKHNAGSVQRHHTATSNHAAATSSPQTTHRAPVQHKAHAPAIEAKAIHHKPHKSATLMRKAVKQPKPVVANVHKIQPKRSISSHTTDGEVAISARSRLAASPIKKLAHKAEQVHQSSAIQHFNSKTGAINEHAGRSPMPVSVKPMHVKQPSLAAVAHHLPNSDTNTPAPINLPPHNPSHAIIQKGLMAANSHEQHRLAYNKGTRRKLISAGAGTLAAIILAGYIAYINIPNIAMRVAASRAGFSAAMPENPAGYSLKGPIKYAPGRITFTLRSNSSDSAVAITETSSNWDSQSLLKNHVRPNANGNYEAVESSGRTLYLYGDSVVTWVHGGVWYEIEGNSQLGRDQLIKMASSM